MGMTKPRLVCFALIALCVLCTKPAEATDVHQLAQAVDQHYNRMKTLRADFTESYRGAGVERTETGTLWLKKPGKMRWEYRSPREKLFVSDGKAAWFYLPGDRQARRMDARKLDDLRSPLAFLLGKTKLENELQGISIAADEVPKVPGNVVLRGVPKFLAERVNQVLLEVTAGGEIARIVVMGGDEATTEYRFSNQQENIAVKDADFEFAPPPGVEVVEGMARQ